LRGAQGGAVRAGKCRLWSRGRRSPAAGWYAPSRCRAAHRYGHVGRVHDDAHRRRLHRRAMLRRL